MGETTVAAPWPGGGNGVDETTYKSAPKAVEGVGGPVAGGKL